MWGSLAAESPRTLPSPLPAPLGHPTPTENYRLLDVPVDLLAGDADGVIAAANVEQHYLALRAAGARVTYRTTHAGHMDMTFAGAREGRCIVGGLVGGWVGWWVGAGGCVRAWVCIPAGKTAPTLATPCAPSRSQGRDPRLCAVAPAAAAAVIGVLAPHALTARAPPRPPPHVCVLHPPTKTPLPRHCAAGIFGRLSPPPAC